MAELINFKLLLKFDFLEKNHEDRPSVGFLKKKIGYFWNTKHIVANFQCFTSKLTGKSPFKKKINDRFVLFTNKTLYLKIYVVSSFHEFRNSVVYVHVP